MDVLPGSSSYRVLYVPSETTRLIAKGRKFVAYNEEWNSEDEATEIMPKIYMSDFSETQDRSENEASVDYNERPPMILEEHFARIPWMKR